MKRWPFWLKSLAAAAALAALGALAAVVALKAAFPEPKLRAMIVDAARRQLGRDVKLESVGIGLRGVSLGGLEISERPDFSAGTFVRVESFRLRPSWSALLRKKLVVASVAADGLTLRVVKGADGRFNYETLASSAPAGAAASAPAKADGASAPEFAVRRARVTNGAVEYRDEASQASWRITDLDLALDDFALNGPFAVRASLRARGKAGGRDVDARLAADARVDLAGGRRDGFRARFQRATLEAEGLKLVLSGEAAGLDAPAVKFDASLSAAGKTLLDASGAAKLGAALDVDATAKSGGLDTTLIAKYLPQAKIPALTIPPGEAAVTASYAGDRADVKKFHVAWAGGRIDGSGSARGLGTPKPVFDGKASVAADLPEIKPGEYPFLGLPPALGVPAARVDGNVSLSGQELSIGALTAKTKFGSLTASGTVRALGSAKPVPDVSVALALDLPATKAGDLPVAVAALPPGLVLPAARVEGTVAVKGDDARLQGVTIRSKDSSVRLDGTVAKALSGSPQPDVNVVADVSLPALTDKDLPFPGVPAGLQLPLTHWTADVKYDPRSVRVKSARLRLGKNDVEVVGTVTDPAGRGAFDLIVKCRSFVLGELVQLTPQTRDMKPAGSGFFALSITGMKEKPIYAGKLQFKDAGATVAGLDVSKLNGTVSFDEKRVDVPNLTGMIGDGNLKMDLTVKDYARAPEVQLDAELDRFDLGKFLAAKDRMIAQSRTKPAAEPSAAAPAAAKPLLISTRGHFSIGTLIHPSATVEDVKVGWDLRGLGGDNKDLNGDARLHVGGGKVRSVGDLATQSKLVKVLIFPLLIVQKLVGLGGLGPFPDFNNITLNQIVGDYVFKDGVMTLRQSEMDSDAAQVSATGDIDLPNEGLNLDVTATVRTRVADFAPIGVAVTGTFSQLKTHVKVGQFLKSLIPGTK